jgi:cyclic pyranopterin phosphate synthase
MAKPLTHVAADGRARMVHVGDKPMTRRRAVASGRVCMAPETLVAALGDAGPKGPVVEVARLAGIAGAKRTAELIPLCHLLPIDGIDVSIEADGDRALAIRAEVVTTWRTGVEMEAYTAVCVAGLTLVDMLKAIDRDLVLEGVRLEHKSGGRSGTWDRTGGSVEAGTDSVDEPDA